MSDPLVAALAVGVGGALGAASRHAVGLAVEGRSSIVLVNALGSLLLGAVLAVPAGSLFGGSAATLAVAVGFCGAFTTFSSFAVETVTTAGDGDVAVAGRFAALTLCVSVAAFVAGRTLVGAVVGGI